MKTNLQKILHLNRFFKILKSNEQSIQYSLEKPSIILLRSIYTNWLKSLSSKTQKNFPVYLNNKNNFVGAKTLPFGFINHNCRLKYEELVFEHDLNECAPKQKSKLIFNLIVPEQDYMQYFIQWQRYRKYWWSSITTTPSLFSVDDIKHGENVAEVNIRAKFPWGPISVETVNLKLTGNALKNTSHLTCALSLENALFILLLDGITNSTKDYLRLHRTMAPYQISFALENGLITKETLGELATLLHSRLAKNNISTWLPDFSLSIESQLIENHQMGVAYTAVLTESTLSNGIFYLLNSSSMLTEQLHIADFDSYATSLCGK